MTKLNVKAFLAIICALIMLAVCLALLFSGSSAEALFAGGVIRSTPHIQNEALPALNVDQALMSERFRRPPKEYPCSNPYSFRYFYNNSDNLPLTTKKFNSPKDVVLAFYGILRDASNMPGYSGGCGTIGMAGLPYPYAYQLLTNEAQNEIPLKRFTNSFKGIGYITLLKILPAYSPPGTPLNMRYYMVETEFITGYRVTDGDDYNEGSLFAYYYGLITVEETQSKGWKIKCIDYIPENFLCAPTHGWFYLADAVVEIVYRDNLKLIDGIDKIEQEDSMVYVYASDNRKSYRFDFARITNGYDILLHENILENDSWKETELLPDEWSYLKLTIENSMLSKAL